MTDLAVLDCEKVYAVGKGKRWRQRTVFTCRLSVTERRGGRSYMAPAGSYVTLHPGESVTLSPHQYHEFHAAPGTGSILIGEVSQCNDDNTDNRFYEEAGRFPEIEEDEVPYRLLCNEYPPAGEEK